MKKSLLTIIVLVITLSLSASVRVLTYNALNFGGNDSDRLAYFETILNEIDADIILLQEIEDETGGELLLNALNNGNNYYSGSVYINGPDTNNFLIYKNSQITFASQDTISTDLRDFSEFEMIIDGNLIRFYSCHLKASTGNEAIRLAEVTKLRNRLNLLPEGSEFIIAGDMNFYTSSEPGYQKFIADESNNIGRAEDLSDQVGNWHDNSDFVLTHTQSTRTTQFGGGASGGLDDRFDFILSSYQLNNSVGLEYLESSITPFGNDGEHFNMSINEGTNSSVSPEVAEALYYASDHLPVYADFTTVASTQPLLILTIPNIEVEWQQGTEQSIQWVSSNVTGTVKIELQSEELQLRTVLIESTENDGEWLWNIPEDEALGTYRIVISDQISGEPNDESNNPFFIVEPVAETTINEIQFSTIGPSPLEGQEVITYGIVTGVYDNGFFLQDGAGAWNGICVYQYGGFDVNLGDEITIQATVAEYYEKTELTDVVEYSVVSTGNDIPAASNLLTFEVNQEDYEGVLVEISNAECLSYDSGYGEWLVDDGSGEVMINDLMYAFAPNIGGIYDVKGIVDFTYGEFKIEPRNSNDVEISSGLEEDIIYTTTLISNYPNPFNPTTTISFSIPNENKVELTIYNIKGQEVKLLVNSEIDKGHHSVVWNGNDNSGKSVSSGVYYFKLSVEGKSEAVRKCLLLK
ncbi:MAG: T9SS type A sorting domain-containing protein [Candidatus Cloacimonetes bacterium]|nr:T9SS type A sorting domain-containing protein [Candidatus Cloacimonadota bacterium]